MYRCLLLCLSIVLAEYSPITVFSLDSFNGNATNLYITITTSKAPTIGSIRVTPGYELVGYDIDSNYMIWDRNTRSLGSIWNKAIVSYTVRQKSNELTTNPNTNQVVAKAYLQQNFTGNALFLSLQDITLDTTWKKNIKSFQVTPGYMFVAFADSTGISIFTSDDGEINEVGSDFTSCKAIDLSLAANTSTLNSTDIGLIVGCSFGAAVVCGLIAFFVIRYLDKKKKVSQLHESLIRTASNNEPVPRTPQASRGLDLSYLYKYQLDAAQLQLEKVIGYGSFAEVWKGRYNGNTVAIKKLQNNRSSNNDIQDFINEIVLTKSFKNPNIISIIGVAWTSPADIQSVMEFMDQGDLRDYLSNTTTIDFTWEQKLFFLKSIVNGLVYLHSLSIIHRDLKSRNVLVDSRNGVKLVDFGIAKEDIQGTMTMGVGTYRWMAPEVLQDSSYTLAADIYSLGMIMTEMDTHHIPYQDVINPKTKLPLSDAAIIVGVIDGSIK
ncbi:kinase, partial [Thraustotheca clavata]